MPNNYKETLKLKNAGNFKYMYKEGVKTFKNLYDNFEKKDNYLILKNATIDIKDYPDYEKISKILQEQRTDDPNVYVLLRKNDTEDFNIRPSIYSDYRFLVQPYPYNYEGEKTPEMLGWDLEQLRYKWTS